MANLNISIRKVMFLPPKHRSDSDSDFDFLDELGYLEH